MASVIDCKTILNTYSKCRNKYIESLSEPTTYNSKKLDEELLELARGSGIKMQVPSFSTGRYYISTKTKNKHRDEYGYEDAFIDYFESSYDAVEEYLELVFSELHKLSASESVDYSNTYFRFESKFIEHVSLRLN